MAQHRQREVSLFNLIRGSPTLFVVIYLVASLIAAIAIFALATGLALAAPTYVLGVAFLLLIVVAVPRIFALPKVGSSSTIRRFDAYTIGLAIVLLAGSTGLLLFFGASLVANPGLAA